MDEGRQYRVQVSKGRQANSDSVNGYGPCKVRHDNAIAPARDLDDLDYLQQVVSEKKHVRALASDLGARTHRDSNVGFHKRRSVIDTVADHRNGFAGAAEFSHAIQLLLREKFRLHIIDLELTSDRAAD